jgi:hypothetical protein
MSEAKVKPCSAIEELNSSLVRVRVYKNESILCQRRNRRR